MCPLEYPFAYENGKMCCRTQKDFRLGCNGGPQSWDEFLEGQAIVDHTCCKDFDKQLCPYQPKKDCNDNDQGEFLNP